MYFSFKKIIEGLAAYINCQRKSIAFYKPKSIELKIVQIYPFNVL